MLSHQFTGKINLGDHMNFVSAVLTSLLTVTLLVGCDDKKKDTVPPPNILTPHVNIGDQKNYWIQSYSFLSKIRTKPGKPNKGRHVAVNALVSYQVKDVTKSTIDLNVVADHAELQVYHQAAYLNQLLQAVITNGMRYQLTINNEQPLIITQDDTDIQLQIANSPYLSTEYSYLKDTLVSPLLPVSIPLTDNAKVTLHNFLSMKEVNINVDQVNANNVYLTLEGTSKHGRLYGKAVIQKNSGWLEKMALVTEESMPGKFNNYAMRTVLLVGPEDWSNNSNNELKNELQIQNSTAYLNSFPLPMFDAEDWAKQQQHELTTKATVGKIYTLLAADGAERLLLTYTNNTGSNAQLLGEYKVGPHQLFAKDNTKLDVQLLPVNNIIYRVVSSQDNDINNDINIATYYPKQGKIGNEPVNLKTINRLNADVSFIPYQLESLVLPIQADKLQQISSKDFKADITPTDQPNVYILHWQNTDQVKFGTGLIHSTNSALVQHIQPDTETWLTPVESKVVDSVANGYENRVRIAFTDRVPLGLELYVLRKGEKPAFTRAVSFSRQ